jgi:ribosomal protein S18 acetylase RimI-like enzyme
MAAARTSSHRLSRCSRLVGLIVILLSALYNQQQHHDSVHVVFVSGSFVLSSSSSSNSLATNVRTTTRSKPTTTTAPSQAKNKNNKIRIRTSQDSDIKSIAEMLSTASVSNNNNNKNSGGGWSSSTLPLTTINWKVKMDQLWAKADIEALLRARLEAIQEGKRAVARVSDLFSTSSSSYDEIEMYDDLAAVATTATSSIKKDQLYLMWKTNQRLRQCIQRASRETGEDNIWKRHDFATPPLDASWLNHLQMSAIDVESGGQVVGFCEVAMLSNPTSSTLLSVVENDDDDNDELCCDVSSSSSMLLFAPAITNLVTALSHRRRGIASRLLRRAERFVQRKWGYTCLGLYVEKENQAAVALYQSLGYQPVTTCHGGDQLGELWYMVRELNNTAATPIMISKQHQQQQDEAKSKNKQRTTSKAVKSSSSSHSYSLGYKPSPRQA